MRFLALAVFTLFISSGVYSQQKWNLLQCVQYAMANNITVKQSQIQEGFAAIQYNQTKLSKYPSANFNNNIGASFGLRENPTTGVLENQKFLSIGYQFQSSVEIFNWYSKRNT